MMANYTRKHGHASSGTSTRTHRAWKDMLQRCRNPKNRSFADYGGRGITVCDAWLDFRNFLSDMGEKPAGKTLERVNNSEGYSPGNCKWGSYTEQNQNTRWNRSLTICGKRMIVSEACAKFGLNRSTVYATMKKRRMLPIEAFLSVLERRVP